MNNTRDKHNEALFFFNLMKVNDNKKDEFRFYLSAFVSAARSVTLFMQKEYAHVLGFSEWYDSKKEEIKEWQNINILRVRTNHHGSIPLKKTYALELIGDFSREQLLEILLKSKETDFTVFPENVSVVVSSSKIRWDFDTNSGIEEIDSIVTPDVDIITYCNSYLHYLNHIVDECERMFEAALHQQHDNSE